MVLINLWAHLCETLYLWFQRSRQRRRLMKLDDRLLKDVGLNRGQADSEFSKWPWQA